MLKTWTDEVIARSESTPSYVMAYWKEWWWAVTLPREIQFWDGSPAPLRSPADILEKECRDLCNGRDFEDQPEVPGMVNPLDIDSQYDPFG